MERANFSKLISFIKLDFLSLKPYSKSILLLIIMALFFGIYFGEPTTVISIVMVYLVLIMSYPFSISEKNNMDSLYASLAINRKKIVLSRYLCAAFIAIAAVLLSVGFSFIVSIASNNKFNFGEISFTVCIMLMFFSLVISFQYPLYFKLGYNKSKMYGLIPIFILSFGVMILSSSNIQFGGVFKDIDINSLISANTSLINISLLTLSGILLTISFFVSYKFYNKKEL